MDDWEQRKLGDVSPLRGGYAFQSEKFRSQGVPIIRISNILSDGNIGGNYAFYDEQETDDKYSLPDGLLEEIQAKVKDPKKLSQELIEESFKPGLELTRKSKKELKNLENVDLASIVVQEEKFSIKIKLS